MINDSHNKVEPDARPGTEEGYREQSRCCIDGGGDSAAADEAIDEDAPEGQALDAPDNWQFPTQESLDVRYRPDVVRRCADKHDARDIHPVHTTQLPR